MKLIMIDFESHPWKALGLALIAVTAIAYAAIGVYTVKGRSMVPEILPGDRVVLLRWGKIRKGDVVILTLPDSHQIAVKRVMGIPGDSVSYSDGFIHVAEFTLPLRSDIHPTLTVAHVVPVDSLFVAGDYLEASIDSRDYGFISKEYIIGRVLDFGR